MRIVVVFLLLSQFAFAQKRVESRRSNGDLLSGTWKCVRCKDTTMQTISFVDTLYTSTSITPEGVKTESCPYKLKGRKIFIKCEEKKQWHYTITLIDYNTLELKQWKKGNEEFIKTK
ncbi:MAG: hypothetical protein JWO09_1297 [Bacteroidetes bacterium]|nr:hypothetical protein [Bacteroidota bacterium]